MSLLSLVALRQDPLVFLLADQTRRDPRAWTSQQSHSSECFTRNPIAGRGPWGTCTGFDVKIVNIYDSLSVYTHRSSFTGNQVHHAPEVL